MKNRHFISYTVVLASYYISYCFIMGFAAMYLQYKGFNNTIIGMFFAIASASCIGMQGFFGGVLDRSVTLTAKKLFIILNIIITICAVVMYFSWNNVVLFIAYIILGAAILALNTFSSTLAMEYINAGVDLNFSFARGLGSFCYACMTLLMGFVIDRTSILVIFPAFFITMVVVFASLWMLPSLDKKALVKSSKGVASSEKKTGYKEFIKENPRILFLLICILMLYISYTSINNFHINIIESVGGTGKNLGISISVAAFVEFPAMALYQPLSKKFGYNKLLISSCFFFLVKAFLMLIAQNVWMVYLAQSFQFFSYAMFIPSSTFYLNSILKDSDKAKGQSLLGIFTFGLSGVLSSILSGLLLDHFSVRTLLFVEVCLCCIGLTGVIYNLRKMPQVKVI